MPADRKILIVEDNPLLAEALERAGAQLEIETECASDGWEAIEKLEHAHYSTIVIDTDLPRHSGFGVLTYLREEVGDHLENVILMTSSDQDALERHVSGERVRVIRKTMAVDELARAIAVDCSSE
ncbi:MAG TPA: response regulator [Thermoanaerobaculia bacterium]|nr:response regulator [Thermoanaerobaculia bacterium]